MGVTEEGRKLGVRVGTTEELRAKMVEIGAPADVVSDDGQVDIARLDALGLTHRNRKGDHVTIGPRRPLRGMSAGASACAIRSAGY